MTYRPGPPPKDWPAVERELWRISEAIGAVAVTTVDTGNMSIAVSKPAETRLGVPYLSNITVSGGSEPYTYSISSGALPTGLTLMSDGRIVGFPYVAGKFEYTVRVTDNKGETSSTDVIEYVFGALDGIARRKAELAAFAAEYPMPTFNGGKYVHAYIEARLQCDVTDSEALEALLRTTEEGDLSGDRFTLFTTAKLFAEFGDRLPSTHYSQIVASATSDAASLEMMKAGTENLFLQRHAAGIIFGEHLPTETFYAGLTGSQLAAICKDDFLAYARSLWTYNDAEWRSPVYAAVSAATMSGLIQYSTDDDVVSTAQRLLDHYVREYHVHARNNSIYPAKRNQKRIQDDWQTDPPALESQWMDWLFFGSNFDFYAAPYYIHARECILMALDASLPSNEVQSYTPTVPFTTYLKAANYSTHFPTFENGYGIDSTRVTNYLAAYPIEANFEFVKVYVTDHYTLGDGRFDDPQLDLSVVNSDWFGCIWDGNGHMGRLFVSNPYIHWGYTGPDGNPLEDDDISMGSPFRSSGQRENVHCTIFDIPAVDPYLGQALAGPAWDGNRATVMQQYFNVFVPDVLTYVETISGIRFYIDGNIYVAIRGTVTPTVETTVWDGYSKLKFSGALEGVWIAIGHADDYGTYAAFKAWFSGATFTDNLSSTGTLSYTNGSDSLSVTKHSGSPPLVSSVTIDSVAETPASFNRRQMPGIVANNGIEVTCNGAYPYTVRDWSRVSFLEYKHWVTNIAVTAISSDTLPGAVPLLNEARITTDNGIYDVDNFDLVIDASVVPSGDTVEQVQVFDVGDRPTFFVTGDDSTFDTGIGNWTGDGTSIMAWDNSNYWGHIQRNGGGNETARLTITGLTIGAVYELTVDIKFVTHEAAIAAYPADFSDYIATSASSATLGPVTIEFTATDTTHGIGVRARQNTLAEVKFDDVHLQEKTYSIPSCL